LIYCHLYKQNSEADAQLQPAVYSLRKLFEKEFNPELKRYKDTLVYEDIQEEFSEKLQELVSEIFASGNQYYQTPYRKYCQYCSYNKICQRY
jgi:CRISPR/Cas system-associated exonuclease Cas4 (RecB family)